MVAAAATTTSTDLATVLAALQACVTTAEAMAQYT
jgi:hypothetical protein